MKKMCKPEESEKDTTACNSTVPNFFISLLFYKYFSSHVTFKLDA